MRPLHAGKHIPVRFVRPLPSCCLAGPQTRHGIWILKASGCHQVGRMRCFSSLRGAARRCSQISVCPAPWSRKGPQSPLAWAPPQKSGVGLLYPDRPLPGAALAAKTHSITHRAHHERTRAGAWSWFQPPLLTKIAPVRVYRAESALSLRRSGSTVTYSKAVIFGGGR